MKSKLLPFSFLALILGFTTFILASGWISNDQPVIPKNQDINGNKAASEYLNKMIAKYTREGKDEFTKELDKLKKIFEMEQS